MEKTKKKVVYLNIQILRVILCFNIVAMHSINIKNQNKILHFICGTARYYYVPTFFYIILFFILYFYSKEYYKIKRKTFKINYSIYYLAFCIFCKICFYK